MRAVYGLNLSMLRNFYENRWMDVSRRNFFVTRKSCLPEIAKEYDRHRFGNTEIAGWFEENIKKKDFSAFYVALEEGTAANIQESINTMLASFISYMDSAENFYHGFLLGILQLQDDYEVVSNREAGTGRLDIAMNCYTGEKNPIILELKMVKKRSEMEQAVEKALRQKEEKNYDAFAREERYPGCMQIGLAFRKKQCVAQCSKVIYE